jgi:hypothetical protein
MVRPQLVPQRGREADPEYGDLTISLGIVSGRISISRPTWQRVRKAFRRLTLDEQVAIPSGHAFVRVQEVDHGELDLHLEVVNFAKIPLQVEQLTVDWLGLSGNSLTTLGPQPLGLLRPVAPRSVGQVAFRFVLTAKSIRELLERVREAPNTRSSPYAELHLRGALSVSHSENRAQLQFETRIVSPRIELGNSVIAKGL